MKSKGPKHEPCGIPHLMLLLLELDPSKSLKLDESSLRAQFCLLRSSINNETNTLYSAERDFLAFLKGYITKKLSGGISFSCTFKDGKAIELF